MRPNYPNPPKSRLVINVNKKHFEIDFVNHNIGIYYTLDIKEPRYKYFQNRFFERLKFELGIDLKKIFRKKDYFRNIYFNFNNIAEGINQTNIIINRHSNPK